MKRKILSVCLITLSVMLAALFLTYMSAADESYVDLTTLKVQNATVGWGSLCVNKDLNGGAIDMANDEGGTTVYEKGFVAHASSSLDFDISGLGVTMFTSCIGADHNPANAATASTSIIFIVKADGKKLYESRVLGYNDPAQSIAVAIPANTQTLQLITDDAGSNTGDHSAWGDPRLYSDGSLLEKLADLSVSTEKNVYLTGESVQIAASCKDLGGREKIPAQITYTSSDPTVGEVNDAGLLTGKKAGVVRITVKAVDGETTIEKTIAVSFMDKAEIRHFDVSSPDGNVKMQITLDDQGSVSFEAFGKDGLKLLNSSRVGMNTELCDFSNALIFLRQTPVTEFDETYMNVSGKKSSVRNHFNETVLTFEKDVYFFDVHFRLYDEGFAYRFVIRAKDGSQKDLTVVRETGTFALPDKSTVTAELISTLSSSFCYETGYTTLTNESLSKNRSRYVCFPALVGIPDANGKQSGTYVLYSESDLYGNGYFGSVMTPEGDGVYGLTQAPKVNYVKDVTVATDFSSPWRFGIVGTLGEIVESDLTENLAPAPEGDFSWVEPGVTAWMWLSEGYDGQRNEATIRDYVDLAAEMGWKYLILDEGWQPNSSRPGRAYDGYFNYFDSLVKYAADKGVGFIAWVKYVDLDTPAEREILREWAAKGIKGIKADFFDSEDPDTIEGFKAIYDLCAECHLIVNCHGAGKPTGERHTWPNVINREAVNGEEYGGFWVNNAVVWAYTRNVVGPIDITPRLYPTASGNTLAVQLACNVIFESGIPCMASDSEDYRGFNGASFFKNLPAAWDDVHFIDGKLGDYVTLARRSGDNWFAATISNSAKRGLSMPLDFLDDCEYFAMIYKDKSAKEIAIETKIVTNKDTLEYNVQKQGGYVVKFIKTGTDLYLPTGIKAPEKMDLTVGFLDKVDYTLEGSDIQIPDVVFESADPSVVSVDAQGNLQPLKKGSTVVTVSSLADSSVKAEIRISVRPCPYTINDRFSIVNQTPNNGISFVLNDVSKIRKITSTGSAGRSLSKNEICFLLPDGDCTVTLTLDNAPTAAGSRFGAILRAGEEFYAIERIQDGGNKISYRSSTGSKDSTLNDARANAANPVLCVTFIKEGGKLTVKCGYNKTGQKTYESVQLAEGNEITLSLFATNENGEREPAQFGSFAIGGEPLPFALETEIKEPDLSDLPFDAGSFIGYAALFAAKND